MNRFARVKLRVKPKDGSPTFRVIALPRRRADATIDAIPEGFAAGNGVDLAAGDAGGISGASTLSCRPPATPMALEGAASFKEQLRKITAELELELAALNSCAKPGDQDRRAAPAQPEENDMDEAAAMGRERERIAAILGAKEAKGREKLAQHFALKTAMTAEDAIAALGAAPLEAGRLDGVPRIDLGDDPSRPDSATAAAGWGKAYARTKPVNGRPLAGTTF